MAKQVLGPNTQVTINSVDLSVWCNQVAISDTKDQVDVSGFGEQYREFLPGLRDAEITATFNQDYAASAVDATLSPLYSGTATFPVKVKPDTSGTVVYTMTCYLYEYGPVSGAVGAENQISATFKNAGTAGMTRGTS